jgi:hypothetical protein
MEETAKSILLLIGYLGFGVPNDPITRQDGISIAPAPAGLFKYPLQYRCTAPFSQETIFQSSPPPAPNPGNLHCFVPSKTWKLVINQEEMMRGCYYLNERSFEEVAKMRQPVLQIGRHPDIKAKLIDDPLIPNQKKYALPHDLHGLTQMEPGIPYYVGLKGQPRDCYLAGLTHTVTSLHKLYSASGNPIAEKGAAALLEIRRIVLEKKNGLLGSWINH